MAEFFDYLKALYSKNDIEYDATKFNPWMMLQFVSHDHDHLEEVEAINRYLYVIKPVYIWNYLRYVLPYNRSKYLKYIKKGTININEEAITELMETYQISRLEARTILGS
jgi:hypothetical protein